MPDDTVHVIALELGRFRKADRPSVLSISAIDLLSRTFAIA